MTAHYNRDEIASAAMHRGHQVEARGAGKTCLDAIHPIDRAEQVIVIAHCFAVIDKRLGGEILIVAREVLLDGAAKQRLIAGRGDLIVIRQARGVHIGRASHPEGAGPLRHQLGEIALVATKISRPPPRQHRSPTW